MRQLSAEERVLAVESGLDLNLGSATYELRDLGQFVNLHYIFELQSSSFMWA